MTTGHLNREQLLAFRDGKLRDPRLLGHLAVCAECQAAFDDSRWALALLRLSETDATEPVHPDRDELAGYVDNALSRPRQEGIERHLAHCRRCMVVYRRLREARIAAAYSSPAPELLRYLRRAGLSARQKQLLGRLLLRPIGTRLRWLFEPAGGSPALDEFVSYCRELSLDRQADEAWGPSLERLRFEAPPQSARARRARLTGPHRALPDAASIARDDETARTFVTGREWTLQVEAVEETDRPRLEMRVLDSRTGRPVADASLWLRAADGSTRDVRTGKDGRVRLSVAAGRSVLGIGTEPTEMLELDVPN